MVQLGDTNISSVVTDSTIAHPQSTVDLDNGQRSQRDPISQPAMEPHGSIKDKDDVQADMHIQADVHKVAEHNPTPDQQHMPPEPSLVREPLESISPPVISLPAMASAAGAPVQLESVQAAQNATLPQCENAIHSASDLLEANDVFSTVSDKVEELIALAMDPGHQDRNPQLHAVPDCLLSELSLDGIAVVCQYSPAPKHIPPNILNQYRAVYSNLLEKAIDCQNVG